MLRKVDTESKKEMKMQRTLILWWKEKNAKKVDENIHYSLAPNRQNGKESPLWCLIEGGLEYSGDLEKSPEPN